MIEMFYCCMACQEKLWMATWRDDRWDFQTDGELAFKMTKFCAAHIHAERSPFHYSVSYTYYNLKEEAHGLCQTDHEKKVTAPSVPLSPFITWLGFLRNVYHSLGQWVAHFRATSALPIPTPPKSKRARTAPGSKPSRVGLEETTFSFSAEIERHR